MMVLDILIKWWCEDLHDKSKDDEFFAYAKYVAFEPWIRGLKRNRLFLCIVLLLTVGKAVMDGEVTSFSALLSILSEPIAFMGIGTLTFLLYGLKRYNLQDGTTLLFYGMMAAAMCVVYDTAPTGAQTIFTIAAVPICIFVNFLLPMRYRYHRDRMKNFHAQQIAEAEKRVTDSEKAAFDHWNYSRNNHRRQHVGHYSDDLQQYAEAESNFSDTKQYASVLPVGQAESWSDSDYSDDFESDDFEDNDSDEFDDFDRDAFDDDSSDESNDFESDAFDSDAFDDADVESVDADDFSESNPFDDETEEDDDFISPVSASENTFGSADTFDSAATSDDSDPYNDPELAMDTARFLFEGFSSDLSTLKSRYRELAKQYHPDSGGSNGLMQCINHVYDELCDQLK